MQTRSIKDLIMADPARMAALRAVAGMALPDAWLEHWPKLRLADTMEL
jgi:hypothetical protein